jgi:hypothetical protein
MITTSTTPTAAMPNPYRQGCPAANRPSSQPPMKSMASARTLEARRAVATSAMKRERENHWKGGQNHEHEHAARPRIVLALEARGRRTHFGQPLAQDLKRPFTGTVRELTGQRIGNKPMGFTPVWRDLDTSQHRHLPVPFGECADEVHHRVGQSPGDVAAQGGEHHGVNFLAARGRRAERAGKGERHEDAKDDLRHALDRVEHRNALLRHHAPLWGGRSRCFVRRS